MTTMLDVRRTSVQTANRYCSCGPNGQLAWKMSTGDTFLFPHTSTLSSCKTQMRECRDQHAASAACNELLMLCCGRLRFGKDGTA